MSEKERMTDISTSEALLGVSSTEPIIHQANTVDSHATHDYGVDNKEYQGARHKIYTSTPVKFTPGDSVFSKTEALENLSKCDTDSVIQKQLQRIQDINQKYEELANSKLDIIKTEHIVDSTMPLSSGSGICCKTDAYQDDGVTLSHPSARTKSLISQYAPLSTESKSDPSGFQPQKDSLKVTFSLPSTVFSVNGANQIPPLVYTRTQEVMAFGSKDPLCLELDINVSEDEQSTVDDDLRPDFYPGMCCPVVSCHGKTYQSINTLWKHWKKIHREKVPLFKCTFQLTDGLCGFVSTDVGNVRKHHVSKHRKCENMKIYKEMVVNKKFVSLGDAKCPKKGRNLNVRGRNAAAAERLSQPVIGTIQSGRSVNRDECVILSELTVHGQVQYKAQTYIKKHWQPKLHKK